MGGGVKEADDAITDINVTPLVDIVLVLLIIFMVTAKLIVSQAVPLDLPRAATGNEVQVVFSVVLAADGTTMVNSQAVANDDAILPLAREARKKESDSLRAVIKADGMVTHSRVIHVLDLLKQAQISKIAFGVSPIPPAPGGVVPAPTGVPAPAKP